VQDLVGLVLAVPRAVLVLLTVVVIVVEVHQRLEHLSDGILVVCGIQADAHETLL